MIPHMLEHTTLDVQKLMVVSVMEGRDSNNLGGTM